MRHLNSKDNIAKSDFKGYFLYCMDTRFLESFVTVVEQGSVAEAARRLNLTAAAIAQRIHALESDIGAPLVSRFGRTVRPTEAGVAILGRARNLLREVRDLGSVATDDSLRENCA